MTAGARKATSGNRCSSQVRSSRRDLPRRTAEDGAQVEVGEGAAEYSSVDGSGADGKARRSPPRPAGRRPAPSPEKAAASAPPSRMPPGLHTPPGTPMERGVRDQFRVLPANTSKPVGEGVRGRRPRRPASRQHRCRERERGHRLVGARGGSAAVETLAPNAVPHLVGTAPRKRMLTRDHLVQHHAQRPDVVTLVGRPQGQHLGRQVAQGAAQGRWRRSPRGPDRNLSWRRARQGAIRPPRTGASRAA